jgi:hypothetical protein
VRIKAVVQPLEPDLPRHHQIGKGGVTLDPPLRRAAFGKVLHTQYILGGFRVIRLARGKGSVGHWSRHSFNLRRLRRNHVRMVLSGTAWRAARST